MNWQQQRILLIGASGGLGHALALQFIQRGAQVIGVQRSQAKPSQTYPIISADITQVSDREALFETLGELDTELTGVVFCAGVSAVGTLPQLSEAQIYEAVAINLTAPMLLTQGLLKLPYQLQWLQFVGSMLGHIGYPGQAVYGASKAGLQLFTEALRRELTTREPRILYAAPRAIATPFNDGLAKTLNEATNTSVDRPEAVALQLLDQIARQRPNLFIGRGERIFRRLNQWLPQVLDRGLAKVTTKLIEIERQAMRKLS